MDRARLSELQRFQVGRDGPAVINDESGHGDGARSAGDPGLQDVGERIDRPRKIWADDPDRLRYAGELIAAIGVTGLLVKATVLVDEIDRRRESLLVDAPSGRLGDQEGQEPDPRLAIAVMGGNGKDRGRPLGAG